LTKEVVILLGDATGVMRGSL